MLRRWLELTSRERRLLCLALVRVAGVRALLSVARYQTLRDWAGRSTPARFDHSPEECVWAVQAAARRVPRATCLTQALALQRLLAQSGHASRIEIGATRANGKFEAHAWVVCGGDVLLGGGDLDRYRPMLAWEAANS